MSKPCCDSGSSVLTVAVNSLQGSAFQGDKVYRIDVDLSREALGDAPEQPDQPTGLGARAHRVY